MKNPNLTDHLSKAKASAKEQLRFLAELLPYMLAKKKELEISGELLMGGAHFRQDLTNLSPDELRIFLKAYELVKPEEQNGNEE